MGLSDINKNINWLGEFSDPSLENEFWMHDMRRALQLMKPIVWMVIMLAATFLILDFFLVDDRGAFALIVIAKMLFILLTLGLLIWIKYIKDFRMYVYGITIYEIISVLSLLFVFHQYAPSHYLVQTVGTMTILFGLFIVPNRWINMLGVSLFTGICFITMSIYCIKGTNIAEFITGVIYIGVVIILFSVSSFLEHCHRRINYIANKELIRLSTIDPLTGAYNRTKLNKELKQWIAYSKRYNTPLSVMIFDFDNFKKVNDAHGHLTGDSVLAELANLIQKNIRETDIFGRWGGDEFVLLLPNTHITHALDLAKRLREKVEGYAFKNIGKMTCSFGLAQLSCDDDVESLLQKADRLLYEAKKTGKNTVVFQTGKLGAKGEL